MYEWGGLLACAFVENRRKSPQIAKIATYAGFADPNFRLQQRAQFFYFLMSIYSFNYALKAYSEGRCYGPYKQDSTNGQKRVRPTEY